MGRYVGRVGDALLILAVLLLAGCHAGPQETKRNPVPVGVKVVHSGIVHSHRSYLGIVEEASSTPVGFGIGGRVTAIHVKSGQIVKAGDLLATIDSRDAANACDVAAATFEQARDGYNRARQVYEKGSLPEIRWV